VRVHSSRKTNEGIGTHSDALTRTKIVNRLSNPFIQIQIDTIIHMHINKRKKERKKEKKKQQHEIDHCADNLREMDSPRIDRGDRGFAESLMHHHVRHRGPTKTEKSGWLIGRQFYIRLTSVQHRNESPICFSLWSTSNSAIQERNNDHVSHLRPSREQSHQDRATDYRETYNNYGNLQFRRGNIKTFVCSFVPLRREERSNDCDERPILRQRHARARRSP